MFTSGLKLASRGFYSCGLDDFAAKLCSIGICYVHLFHGTFGLCAVRARLCDSRLCVAVAKLFLFGLQSSGLWHGMTRPVPLSAGLFALGSCAVVT